MFAGLFTQLISHLTCPRLNEDEQIINRVKLGPKKEFCFCGGTG